LIYNEKKQLKDNYQRLRVLSLFSNNQWYLDLLQYNVAEKSKKKIGDSKLIDN